MLAPSSLSTSMALPGRSLVFSSTTGEGVAAKGEENAATKDGQIEQLLRSQLARIPSSVLWLVKPDEISVSYQVPSMVGSQGRT